MELHHVRVLEVLFGIEDLLKQLFINSLLGDMVHNVDNQFKYIVSLLLIKIVPEELKEISNVHIVSVNSKVLVTPHLREHIVKHFGIWLVQLFVDFRIVLS